MCVRSGSGAAVQIARKAEQMSELASGRPARAEAVNAHEIFVASFALSHCLARD